MEGWDIEVDFESDRLPLGLVLDLVEREQMKISTLSHLEEVEEGFGRKGVGGIDRNDGPVFGGRGSIRVHAIREWLSARQLRLIDNHLLRTSLIELLPRYIPQQRLL